MDDKPSYEHLRDALIQIREEMADDQRGEIPLSLAYVRMAGRMRLIACLALDGEDYSEVNSLT